MQTTSSEYERLAKSQSKVYETKLVIDGVGEYNENEIFDLRTSTVTFKGSPKVGKAVAAEINVSLIMPEEIIPQMACLRVYTRTKGEALKSSAVSISNGVLNSEYVSHSDGAISFSQQSGGMVSGEVLSFPVNSSESLTSEWIPQGVFFIDTRKVTANADGLDILTIHGYDAMLKADQEYSNNAVVGDAKDTEYVQVIANAIDVNVDPRTWDIMRGYKIPMPLGYTMREILGYIASSYVGFFIITEVGNLRLVSMLELPKHYVENLLVDENGDIIIFGADAILA